MTTTWSDQRGTTTNDGTATNISPFYEFELPRTYTRIEKANIPESDLQKNAEFREKVRGYALRDAYRNKPIELSIIYCGLKGSILKKPIDNIYTANITFTEEDVLKNANKRTIHLHNFDEVVKKWHMDEWADKTAYLYIEDEDVMVLVDKLLDTMEKVFESMEFKVTTHRQPYYRFTTDTGTATTATIGV